jgi:DNA-binding transcriptional ArsR family regulator/DNA-directed RNA polymerase subunit RPC12/RpoP
MPAIASAGPAMTEYRTGATNQVIPVDLEVKCAGCNAYFTLNKVKLHDNGYYCRKCYQQIKRKKSVESKKENRCYACGSVLTPFDSKVTDGGKSYCPVCYNKIILASNDEGQGKMGTFIKARCASCDAPLDLFDIDHRRIHDGKRYCEKCYGKIMDAHGHNQQPVKDGKDRCVVCGKALAPEEARVLYANNSFCIACYDKSTPYLDMKPYWAQTQVGDAVAAMRTDRIVRCGKCNRDLGPLDVRVHDGKAIYCESCYRGARGATGNRRFFLAEQAGINTRPGTTSLRDAENLFECMNCGHLITRERLEKDARGKSRCPRCGKKVIVPLNDKAATEPGREIRCDACGRVLSPGETRVQDDGKSYCVECHNKDLLHRQSSATVMQGPARLIECESCGREYSLDRLIVDRKGRYTCPNPKCGKVIKVMPEKPDTEKPAKTKPEKPGTEDFAVTAQLFKCLGDPCRVKIIESLSEKELCVFEFVDLTGFQYSAISYHLKMLKELGLIKSYERGNFMVYSLTDKGKIVHEFIEKSKGLS